MDAMITTETKITRQDYVNFTWYTVLRKGKHLKPSFLVMLIVFSAALVFVISSGLLMGIDSFMDTTFAYLLALLIIGILFVPLINYIAIKNYKSSNLYADMVQKYEFAEDILHIQAIGSALNGNSVYQYDALCRVAEVKDAFYLFVSNAQAFIVSKRGMNDYTVDTLRNFLSRKTGAKYVRCF